MWQPKTERTFTFVIPVATIFSARIGVIKVSLSAKTSPVVGSLMSSNGYLPVNLSCSFSII